MRGRGLAGRHAINAGTYIDPSRSKIKIEAWADEWLKGQGHLKQGTRARYEGIVERYVNPRWVPHRSIRSATQRYPP